LMTIQDIPRYTSLLISTSLSRYLKYFVKEFKMKKAFASLLSRVTMELSLKMLSSDDYVKRMIFSKTSLHQEHFNKMG